MTYASDDLNDDLLFRFVADQCTASECADVERWIRIGRQNARRVETIRQIRRASVPMPSRDVDRMWTRLRGATERQSAVDVEFRSSNHVGTRPIRYAGLARLSRHAFPKAAWAAALVALVSGGAVFVLRSHPAPPPSIPSAPHVYATGPAQTANIRLSDGTRVKLAPMSRLRDLWSRNHL